MACAHGVPGGLDDRLPAEHPRGPPLEPQEEPGTGRPCLTDEVCVSLELEMADESLDVIFQSISSQPSENGVDMHHIYIRSCVGSVLYESLNVLLLYAALRIKGFIDMFIGLFRPVEFEHGQFVAM